MISIFDIFTIGIGPSSSHTVGPMRAAKRFIDDLTSRGYFNQTCAVRAELFGSLGLTGRAHGAEKAVLLGLSGYQPEAIHPDLVPEILSGIYQNHTINLNQEKLIDFNEAQHLIFYRNKSLPLHPNGITFSALNLTGQIIYVKSYYSIGGGFVVDDSSMASDTVHENTNSIPYSFNSGDDLLKIGEKNNLKIWEIIYANEQKWRPAQEIETGLQNIWLAMQSCVERGLKNDGILPGGLKVQRRAKMLFQKLSSQSESAKKDPLTILDWVDLYAIAVNEENAAGGRVVTAPTNGAAGIIPAILMYASEWAGKNTAQNIKEFLLTASAIAVLFKQNASISGAEVGCQGEVGVACSMAAAGLTAVMGGTNTQIENAAEIGMEHNLGLTCDPVGGLVQIPCIERNAMGAIKAINASRLALRGDGSHKISLDKVIKTMRETGLDMMSKYKETSQGGLATNYVEC